ncbi:MAG: methylmalonyl-CoA mutase, partial [Chitinophagaceae bacterium]
GGSVDAIEQGFIQDEIAASAYKYQQDIEAGDKIIVGVNKFQTSGEQPIPPFKIDESIQQLQVAKIEALKARRDNEKVNACLNKVAACANGTDNLMPAVLEAVENYCTLGEIADTLRNIFGEYK